METEEKKAFSFPPDFVARVKQTIPLRDKDPISEILHRALDDGNAHWVGYMLNQNAGSPFDELWQEYLHIIQNVEIFSEAKNPRR